MKINGLLLVISFVRKSDKKTIYNEIAGKTVNLIFVFIVLKREIYCRASEILHLMTSLKNFNDMKKIEFDGFFLTR